MSLLHPDPTCTVNTDPTTDGNNVNPLDNGVSIELLDTAGVKQWSITCTSTDDLNTTAAVNATIVVDNITKTAIFTAPNVGAAMQFKSVVNNGRDANGVVDPSLTTYFGVYVLTTSGYRVAFFDEKLEGSAAFGWITKLNAVVRNNLVTPASAGAGMVFSAGAYNVVANADASIVVGADDIRLKVAYQTLLNGATASATVGTLALRAATTSFTGLACTTLAASSNATVGGTLDVTGVTTLAALACTTLVASGAVTCSTTLGVTGATTLTGAVICSTTLGVTGQATFTIAPTAPSYKFTSLITETRISPISPTADSANWKVIEGGFATNLVLNTDLGIPIDPPQGATLDAYVVRFQGAAAHAGLPGTMPSVALNYYNVATGFVVSVATGQASDTSANTTAYQLVHTITANNVGAGIGHVVDKTTRKYFIALTAESGANALVGAIYYQTSVTWKRSAGSAVGQD